MKARKIKSGTTRVKIHFPTGRELYERPATREIMQDRWLSHAREAYPKFAVYETNWLYADEPGDLVSFEVKMVRA